jgi:hypothetical protein
MRIEDPERNSYHYSHLNLEKNAKTYIGVDSLSKK